jgi:hypothetical protein
MIPLYLAQMKNVEMQHPELWEEFQKGNWVVNRNAIPFCAIGADHALEHVNRAMKVTGGIIGITLNENARARFFLASPQLSTICEDAMQIMGNKETINDPLTQPKHHQNTVPARQRLHRNVYSLVNIIQNIGDPFQHYSEDVINLVTKEVMSQQVKHDILQLSEIGEELFKKFRQERISSNELLLWAPLKRRKLQTWSVSTKKVRYNDQGQVFELKEDRNLFARMLIAARSRPKINLQEIISTYELSVVPRSLFNSDGSLSHTTSKCQLMHIIENHQQSYVTDLTENIPTRNHCTAVVDAMAEVQSMGKPHWVKTCYDLGIHFVDVRHRKYLQHNRYYKRAFAKTFIPCLNQE